MVTLIPGPPIRYSFDSPTIDADASMRLIGAAGESAADWTLGFIQLKYVCTNQARYRGATVRHGSATVSNSNQIVCRDTDPKSTEVWYDSLKYGKTGPLGTNTLAAAAVLPAAKFLDVPAHLYDKPHRQWPAVHTNMLAGGRPNFLHHVIIELLFCTMLVAQDPAGKFHMLKHFYWNVIWDHMFKRDATGNVSVDRKIRLKQHVQHQIHTGNPRDPIFFGKEYSLKLPISSNVSRRAPHVREAADWAES